MSLLSTGFVTLADSAAEWLVPLLIIVFAVVSSLVKAGKESKTQQERKRQREARQGGQRPSLDELAERRRRQLRELAERRRGDTAPTESPRPSQRPQTAPPLLSHEDSQTVQQHMEERERRRRAEARAQAQRQQARSLEHAQQLAEQRRLAELKRQRQIAERMRVVEGAHDPRSSRVHRHVRNTAASRPVESHLSLRARLLANRQQSLRQAVVLREVFDHPVALREPTWTPGGQL